MQQLAALSECSSFQPLRLSVASETDCTSPTSARQQNPAGQQTRQQNPPVGPSSAAQRNVRQRAKKGKRKRAGLDYSILGQDVEIPGTIFGVNVPGLYYRARVMRKDSSHPKCVTIRFSEDNSRFWLPLSQVLGFKREEKERKEKVKAPELGLASDQYAAEVLVSLSGDLAARSRSDVVNPRSADSKSHEADTTWNHEIEALSPTRGARHRAQFLAEDGMVP